MSRLVVRELHGLVRCWPLWLLLPVVAVVGWALLPVNADLYLTYINHDPEGPTQLLERYRTDVFAVYTSGLGSAQLFALVAGAFLVLRDPRLTARTPNAADPGPLIVAKAVVAGLLGLVLAGADLAVVLPSAYSHLAARPVLTQSNIGVVSRLDLTDGPVWMVVLSAGLGVAMFAVIGVGLAARLGRWWPFGVLAGVLSLTALLYLVADRFDNVVVNAAGSVLLPTIGLLALPMALLWLVTLSRYAPAAAAVLLLVAVIQVLLGYDAARRRLARDGRLATNDRLAGQPGR